MESKNLLEDFKTTTHWIADNIENKENAYILITWLNKMLNQLINNEYELHKLIEEYNKNHPEDFISTE